MKYKLQKMFVSFICKPLSTKCTLQNCVEVEVAVLVSVEDVADVEETGGADVEEAGVVDVEDVADVEETGGADVEETSPSQLCLSSPIVLNAVVLWLPSPCFSPSHLNITLMVVMS